MNLDVCEISADNVEIDGYFSKQAAVISHFMQQSLDFSGVFVLFLSVKIPNLKMATKETPKYDWYQTETHVVVEVRIKGADPSASDCKFSEKGLTFSTVVPQSSANYELDFRLAHPICAEESVMKVAPSKVELKLKKRDGLRWSEVTLASSKNT
jgi:hypothetical protein